MKLLEEENKLSFRRLWSLVGLFVFGIYASTDLTCQVIYNRSINMPYTIAGILGTIVAAYFGKRALDKSKVEIKKDKKKGE